MQRSSLLSLKTVSASRVPSGLERMSRYLPATMASGAFFPDRSIQEADNIRVKDPPGT